MHSIKLGRSESREIVSGERNKRRGRAAATGVGEYVAFFVCTEVQSIVIILCCYCWEYGRAVMRVFVIPRA